MASQIIRNPALNEYVFTLLFELTPEQKKKLSRPFLKIAMSEIRSKNFSENSTLDEKVRLLTELGVGFSLVFMQDDLQSMNQLKIILKKYEEQRVASASKQLADVGIFVSSDKQVKHFLGLMADTISHRSYFLNLEYNRVGFHIEGWTKERGGNEKKEFEDTVRNSELIVKTFLNTIMNLQMVDSIVGVNEHQMKVLLYLYGYRHTYISKERMDDYFDGNMQKRTVTSSLKRLYLNNFIKKGWDISKKEYTITGTGIEIVNTFVQRVLKQNNT